MNRLHFLLLAKNQYNIQSPFLFGLYTDVISPRLSEQRLHDLGIDRNDHYHQLLYKLSDHYNASPSTPSGLFSSVDDLLTMPDGSLIALFRNPHRNKSTETTWHHLYSQPTVTLSVDLFHTGLLFTSPKLSKQHFLLRT